MRIRVKDLLEELKNADPDTTVSFMIDDGCCGDWIDLKCHTLEHIKLSSKPGDELVQIRFQYLPGYRSCKQSGQTMRAHEAYWKKFNPSVLEEEAREKDED